MACKALISVATLAVVVLAAGCGSGAKAASSPRTVSAAPSSTILVPPSPTHSGTSKLPPGVDEAASQMCQKLTTATGLRAQSTRDKPVNGTLSNIDLLEAEKAESEAMLLALDSKVPDVSTAALGADDPSDISQLRTWCKVND
jgi:hypothetical protein